jgi:putative selenate reductase
MDPVEFSIQRARRKDDKNLVEDVETIRINQSFQIINIGDFCNECGNCSTFCPTSGEPYRAKPKFYLTPESFAGEANGYMPADGVLHARVEGEPETLSRQGNHLIYETKDVQARLNSKTFAVEEITFSEQAADKIELRHAARMCLLMIALNDFYLFQ